MVSGIWTNVAALVKMPSTVFHAQYGTGVLIDNDRGGGANGRDGGLGPANAELAEAGEDDDGAGD